MYKPLGDSDLNITPVGIGCWAMGGEWGVGWGPQDDAKSVEAIRRGVERGINWLDTAAIYGAGHSEEVVGRALKEIGAADRPLVFTKCSLVWEGDNIEHCLKADSLRREAEDSLRRLGVDVLDLYQIHWPTMPGSDDPDTDIEEGWTELAKLKEEGKVRYIGVSNFDASQMKRAQMIAPITSLQPPYSMLMRQIEDEILPFCQAHNIGTIVYSPMHSGLLSGTMTRERVAALPETDWRRNINRSFQEPHLSRNLELVEVLRGIGDRYGRSPGEAAIAWTLRHPAVTAAIVGARSAEQVDGFAGALEYRLTESEIAEIEAALPEPIEVFDQ